MGPRFQRPKGAAAGTLLALGLALQLPAAPAAAHFLWVGIGSGAPPGLRVTFSEGPDEPTSGTLLPRLEAARARDAAGRPLALSPGSGAMTAALASGTGAAAVTQHWGVVDRDGATFLLEYYAKAARSIEQAGTDVHLPLEIFARRSGSNIVASVRRGGAAVPQASVRVHLPSGQPVDKTADASGEITLEGAAPGTYGLRARWVEDQKGSEGGKAYPEVRHYTTLTFAVSTSPASGVVAAANASAARKADPTAYALLKAAHDSRQVMPQDFPGFRCRIVFQDGDTSFEGTLVYRRQGATEVTLEGADKDSLDWVRSQIMNLTGHRRGGDFAQGDGKYPLELGPEDHNRYGRLVIVHDDSQSSYRVKDNRVLEVTRTMEGSRFTISVIETMEADAGKYLANHFLVSYRDASTGALQKVEGYRDGYARVDGVWLPTSRTVLTSGTETSPRVRTIRLRAPARVEVTAQGEPAPPPAPPAEAKPAPSVSAAPPAPAAPADPAASRLSVTESVTVLATGTPEAVRDTPTPVTVIDAVDIEQRLMNDTRDLVRWVPGVSVDNNVTRLGLNGFNIRGIGGNRVQTQIDGTRAGEQFDFGPISVNQYALDLEALKSVEIVRSAGSALYGSDALGGVVSLSTRDPKDYLAASGRDTAFVVRTGYDGRRREFGESLTGAFRSGPWSASLFAARRDGQEVANRGDVATQDFTRTAPNPQSRQANNLLGKLVFEASDGNEWKLSGEWFDGRTRTDVLSSQGTTVSGATATTVSHMLGTDAQERLRFQLEQDWRPAVSTLFDRVAWRASWQKNQTRQDTVETRLSQSPTSTREILRTGLTSFDQWSFDTDLRLQKHFGGPAFSQLVTLGGSWSRDAFDMLRNRVDINTASGAVVPGFPLTYPTKYFPRSTGTNLGIYLQDEISIQDGFLRLIPGVRFDRYDLKPDTNDAIYLSGNAGIATPVAMSDSAVSPRVGAVVRISGPLSAYGQYARGFRAPAYSFVNNGFTNLASGYTTLPNPDLKPEHSDNVELGLRGTFRRADFSLGVFDNHFANFIEIAATGVNPSTGLLEFQPQNVTRARIRGVEVAGNVFFGPSWSAHTSYAWIEGTDPDSSAPINSIPPNRLVLGLRFAPAASPLGAELTATFVNAKNDVDTSAVDQFRAPSYRVVDLTAFYNLTETLSLQAGLFNIFNQKSWAWSDVQGLSASSTVLDRYTSPGISGSLALRWRM